MSDDTAPKRRDYAEITLTMALVGAACTCAYIVSRFGYLPDWVADVGLIGVMLSVIVMLIGRKSDEYIDGLWTSSATIAFIVIVLWQILVPYTEGFIDGFVSEFYDGALASKDGDFALGSTRSQNIPTGEPGIVALVAFFLTFHWKRFFGNG